MTLNTKNLLLSLAVISFVFFGCGSPGGDQEPNNTIDEAFEIKAGDQFAISINPEDDVDWFKVDVPEQGYLRVQSNQVPENLVLEVSFALLQEWEGEKYKTIRGWHRLPDAVFIPEAGTYYFIIHDDYDDAFSEEEIQIKVDFLKEFDLQEANNSVEEAGEVDINSELEVAIYPKGDIDWFKVKIEKQGYLTIMSKDVEGDIVPEVSFVKYDPWGNGVEDIRSWKRLPDACAFVDTGYYYVKLHDDYDDECSEQTFKLKFEFLDEFDMNEPNNVFTTADTVAKGDTLNVAIFPRGDSDYFYLKAEKTGELKFLAKDVDGVNPEICLSVINPDNESELTKISSWERFPAKFEVEAGKEYYIHIHDDYDDESSTTPFNIRIE